MIQATAGRLNKQIAYGIGIAEATVKVHRSNLTKDGDHSGSADGGQAGWPGNRRAPVKAIVLPHGDGDWCQDVTPFAGFASKLWLSTTNQERSLHYARLMERGAQVGDLAARAIAAAQ
jgi:hypothetical protein